MTVNFIICPAAFLLAGIRPLIDDPIFYAAAFLPYFIFSMGTFYLSMWAGEDTSLGVCS
jgi:hypothetical protein